MRGFCVSESRRPSEVADERHEYVDAVEDRQAFAAYLSTGLREREEVLLASDSDAAASSEGLEVEGDLFRIEECEVVDVIANFCWKRGERGVLHGGCLGRYSEAFVFEDLGGKGGRRLKEQTRNLLDRSFLNGRTELK